MSSELSNHAYINVQCIKMLGRYTKEMLSDFMQSKHFLLLKRVLYISKPFSKFYLLFSSQI